MKGPLRISFKSPDPGSEHDGVDVEYKDRRTRQTETVKCRLPGQQGLKAEKVQALGISLGSGSYILESSEAFIWEPGLAHTVGIRRRDGTLSGPWTATRISDHRLSVMTLEFVPDTSWDREQPHLLFGPVTRECHRVLVSKVTPKGSESVSVQRFNYDDRVYLYDNATAPD